ncbi:MAG: hypothetical protein M3357_10300 [Actinomycetota bacterium]|nr:hypothetical protein [Actinomycetota bacterium]
MSDAVRQWARAIVTGHVSPIEGARRILRDGSGDLDVGGELMVFAGLVGEWEEDETQRQECEARIMDQAALLLADTA